MSEAPEEERVAREQRVPGNGRISLTRRTVGIIVLVLGSFTMLWATVYGFHDYRFAQYGRYTAGALISKDGGPGTPLKSSFSIDREYACGAPFAPNRVDVYVVGPAGRAGVPLVTRECQQRLAVRRIASIALTGAGLLLVVGGLLNVATHGRRSSDGQPAD